ncbi:DUF2933 domain-containing protein [bacterium]|nr:MAG: DUF2933 domain-containing protein [bacterium]
MNAIKILFSYGVILLCPLMHVMMMKNMDHDKNDGTKKSCH